MALALLRAAPEGEARVTRRALAETAGTSVETAIRVIRRLEVAGIVSGDVGRVRILDDEILRKIAGTWQPTDPAAARCFRAVLPAAL